MNITQEKVDDLNAIIRIKITPEDYKKQYDKKLKEARNQVVMDGFRAGKVPMGMIKKKYGASILADELNTIINENLHKHITENKINVLGNPLPSDEHTNIGEWKDGQDFEFGYKIGLAPEFDLKLSSKTKVTYNKIKVSEEVIDKQIEDFTKRYGTMKVVDSAQKEDMVFGEFVQLDENKKPLEDGIIAKSTVSIPFVDDEKIQKKFIGMKAGDSLIVDPRTISKGDADMAAMLHIKKEEIEGLTSEFQFTAEDVKRLEKAPIDQELFDKIHGEGSVKNEKEFRAKIKEDMSSAFINDSERLFQKDLSKAVLDNLKLELPDEFLKSWIIESNEKPVTMEEVEGEYEQYSNQLKWQLVENKIIQENDIKVEIEEAKDYVKGMLVSQYAQYNMPPPEDAELEVNALKVLENQEETKQIFDYLYKNKVADFCKQNVKITEKEITQDEFIKLFYA